MIKHVGGGSRVMCACPLGHDWFSEFGLCPHEVGEAPKLYGVIGCDQGARLHSCLFFLCWDQATPRALPGSLGLATPSLPRAS